jgi:hypothetical protein
MHETPPRTLKELRKWRAQQYEKQQKEELEAVSKREEKGMARESKPFPSSRPTPLTLRKPFRPSEPENRKPFGGPIIGQYYGRLYDYLKKKLKEPLPAGEFPAIGSRRKTQGPGNKEALKGEGD